ncbi:uncharacterized protein LOC102801614 [Saccoglossus kowalevskii]|uniref:Myb-like protein X-like n=1 Tax=Saccoglossus kowalevskii TaxID=10224 RepID=A0ABM0MS09_SACKO|nr:PREDICTED: myb-like protein X-like [Saccoglossus kowalevskii]
MGNCLSTRKRRDEDNEVKKPFKKKRKLKFKRSKNKKKSSERLTSENKLVSTADEKTDAVSQNRDKHKRSNESISSSSSDATDNGSSHTDSKSSIDTQINIDNDNEQRADNQAINQPTNANIPVKEHGDIPTEAKQLLISENGEAKNIQGTVNGVNDREVISNKYAENAQQKGDKETTVTPWAVGDRSQRKLSASSRSSDGSKSMSSDKASVDETEDVIPPQRLTEQDDKGTQDNNKKIPVIEPANVTPELGEDQSSVNSKDKPDDGRKSDVLSETSYVEEVKPDLEEDLPSDDAQVVVAKPTKTAANEETKSSHSGLSSSDEELTDDDKDSRKPTKEIETPEEQDIAYEKTSETVEDEVKPDNNASESMEDEVKPDDKTSDTTEDKVKPDDGSNGDVSGKISDTEEVKQELEEDQPSDNAEVVVAEPTDKIVDEQTITEVPEQETTPTEKVIDAGDKTTPTEELIVVEKEMTSSASPKFSTKSDSSTSSDEEKAKETEKGSESKSPLKKIFRKKSSSSSSSKSSKSSHSSSSSSDEESTDDDKDSRKPTKEIETPKEQDVADEKTGETVEYEVKPDDKASDTIEDKVKLDDDTEEVKPELEEDQPSSNAEVVVPEPTDTIVKEQTIAEAPDQETDAGDETTPTEKEIEAGDKTTPTEEVIVVEKEIISSASPTFSTKTDSNTSSDDEKTKKTEEGSDSSSSDEESTDDDKDSRKPTKELETPEEQDVADEKTSETVEDEVKSDDNASESVEYEVKPDDKTNDTTEDKVKPDDGSEDDVSGKLSDTEEVKPELEEDEPSDNAEVVEPEPTETIVEEKTITEAPEQETGGGDETTSTEEVIVVDSDIILAATPHLGKESDSGTSMDEERANERFCRKNSSSSSSLDSFKSCRSNSPNSDVESVDGERNSGKSNAQKESLEEQDVAGEKNNKSIEHEVNPVTEVHGPKTEAKYLDSTIVSDDVNLELQTSSSIEQSSIDKALAGSDAIMEKSLKKGDTQYSKRRKSSSSSTSSSYSELD